MTIKTLFVLILSLPTAAVAQPFHDAIPAEFRGTFAPTQTQCGVEHGVELIEVRSDGIHYYEGDDYLLLGVSFSGESTLSRKFVPLFNGRFTGRAETEILGEVNARLEMETPNTLIRYAIAKDGSVGQTPINRWVRCLTLPAG